MKVLDHADDASLMLRRERVRLTEDASEHRRLVHGFCGGAGWLFGNIPIVSKNFSLITIGIVIVSVLPIAFELIRARRRP